MGYKGTFVLIMICSWLINSLAVEQIGWPPITVFESIIVAGILTFVAKAKHVEED
jgi:hypothetical protein